MANKLRFSIQYAKNFSTNIEGFVARDLELDETFEMVEHALGMIDSLVFFTVNTAIYCENNTDELKAHFRRMGDLITQFGLEASLGISAIEERRVELEKLQKT